METELHLAACQSPIERTFLSAYLLTLGKSDTEVVIAGTEQGTHSAAVGLIDDLEYEGVDTIAIQPRTPEATDWAYFPDFIVRRYHLDPTGQGIFTSQPVVVECDGHRYHECTKEQARHDRKKDRDLQELGYVVLRFAGQELHENASWCARDVDRFLAESCYRDAGRKLVVP